MVNELIYWKNDIPPAFLCSVTYTGTTTPVDLTGYTMTLTVKSSKNDTVVILTKTAVLSFPETLGVGTFTWEDGDLNIPAKQYYYDVEIKKIVDLEVVERQTVIGPTSFVILQELTT